MGENYRMQPLTQMQTAYDHFNEHRNTLRMTTGSANLDSLIDSIQEGQFYLFYGSNKTFLDGLVQGLLVDCIRPVREKHGFESMAMYINNVYYYQPDKSKPEKIAIAAKCSGIEPKIVFKNLFVQIAYNQRHQLVVAKQVSDFVESRSQYSCQQYYQVLQRIKAQGLRYRHIEGDPGITVQGLRKSQDSLGMYW